MTSSDINKAIATALGWTKIDFYEDNAGPSFWCGLPPATLEVDGYGDWTYKLARHSKHIPDYSSNLNTMHEAEKTLTDDQKFIYLVCLAQTKPDGPQASRIAFATAAQRAEAFLRALNLWTTP